MPYNLPSGIGPPLNTFVVRLWQEMGSGRSCWRGEVCHIQTGEHVAFADEADLLRFIHRWMRSPEWAEGNSAAETAEGGD